MRAFFFRGDTPREHIQFGRLEPGDVLLFKTDGPLADFAEKSNCMEEDFDFDESAFGSTPWNNEGWVKIPASHIVYREEEDAIEDEPAPNNESEPAANTEPVAPTNEPPPSTNTEPANNLETGDSSVPPATQPEPVDSDREPEPPVNNEQEAPVPPNPESTTEAGPAVEESIPNPFGNPDPATSEPEPPAPPADEPAPKKAAHHKPRFPAANH